MTPMADTSGWNAPLGPLGDPGERGEPGASSHGSGALRSLPWAGLLLRPLFGEFGAAGMSNEDQPSNRSAEMPFEAF